MPMNFLETEDVVKQYANHLALNKVSIQVPEGKVFGLLGPNGAGKTTLIRIINRITAPDSGLVRFNGREFQPEDIYQIGYLPEERGLYKKMKVGEQAIYLAQLKGLSAGSKNSISCLGGTRNSKSCPKECSRKYSSSSPSSTNRSC